MKTTLVLFIIITLLLPFASANGEEYVTPPDSLTIRGSVPSIPQALYERVQYFSNLKGAYHLGWHPTERELLVMVLAETTYQSFSVSAPGAEPIRVTTFAEHASAVYSPDGRWLCIRTTLGGTENNQYFLRDLATGRERMVSDGTTKHANFLFSDDGSLLAFQRMRDDKFPDVWIMEPGDSLSQRKIFDAPSGAWFLLDWYGTEQVLLSNERSSFDSDLFLLDVAAGTCRQITPTDPNGMTMWSSAEFAPDGTIYVTTNAGHEFFWIGCLNPANGSVAPIVRVDHDVETFDLSLDGATLAYVLNVDGVSRYCAQSTMTGAPYVLPEVPAGVNYRGVEFHRTRNEFAFTHVSPASPGAVYSIDLASGTLHTWTAVKGLADFQPPTVETFTWTTWDGRSLSGILYLPPGYNNATKIPAIVNIHGGPESQSRPDWLWNKTILVSDFRVAMIAPNVRGSSGFGKSFAALDDGFLREGAVQDLTSCLDWAEADGRFGKLMVMGASYGGFLSLSAMIQDGHRIACGTDVVGITNMATFLEHTAPYRQDARRAEYGDERDPTTRAFFNRIAPVNNAGRIRNPLLIVQGADDPRVPVSEARQIFDAVKGNGKPVWSLEFADEGHGISRRPNSDFSTATLAQFVKMYLLDGDRTQVIGSPHAEPSAE